MSRKDEGNIPRIYVACLASYNSGKLHGKWIDCDIDSDDIREKIQEMLKVSPESFAEEWAIHDYTNWGSLKLDEHEDIDHLSQIAQLIEEHGEFFGALISHVGGVGQLEEAITLMEQCYQGEYESLADWAEQFLDDTASLSGLPDNLKCYFDYGSYARDCELSGDIFTIEHNNLIHVFWSQY